MRKQKWTGTMGKGNWIKMVVVAGVALVLVKMFSPEPPPPADHPATPQDCLASIQADTKNLRILEGSRSPASILGDLAPLICSGRAVYERLRTEGETIAPGTVTLRLVVEFNGEIISAGVQETSIDSKKFLNELTGLIATSDFSFWNREDEDSVFTYTTGFGHGR
jgi:hypothetical protein